MAHSSYLYRGQPDDEREPIQPYASFATGANEMSALDMAAGAQTLANNGVHLDPYYVEWIDRSNGTRLYTHQGTPDRVFDEATALATTNIMKGVLSRGTARRALSEFPFPAAGKTGTQQDNTNSWYVGYTPQLATAVWVGDPDGYTEMTREKVPEFYELDGVDAVQGGTYPARIWGQYTASALYGSPVEDWLPPPPPARAPARLYLPGEECAYRLVSGSIGPDGSLVPAAVTTTAAPASEPAPAPEVPTGTDAGEATTTTVARVVIQLLPDSTTIPPGVLDPLAPLPSVEPRTAVLPCAQLPAGVIIRQPRPTTP